MKHISYIAFTTLFLGLLNIGFAQTINWRNLRSSQKHIININAGLEHGSVAGIGYGYHFNTKKPLVLNLEYSQPVGEELVDDLKIKIGGQLNLVRVNNFFATIKAYGIIRRFENDQVRMVNFGSEFSGTAGIYKKKWWVAGELGFDKAITTHLKHSDWVKENNPEVESGWYIPNGGNFLYGIQCGYSFNANDVYAKVGRTVAQDLKTAETFPWYVQVGWSIKL